MQAIISCEIIPIQDRIYSIKIVLVSCSVQEDKCGSESISVHTHHWGSTCMGVLLASSKSRWDKKTSATLEPDENVTRRLVLSRCVTNINGLNCSPTCLLNSRLFCAPLLTHIFPLLSFSSCMNMLVMYLQGNKYKLLLQLLLQSSISSIYIIFIYITYINISKIYII